MFDELVVLRKREVELHHATLAVKHPELEALVEHERNVLRTPVDTHAGPGAKLVGDLIDERGRMWHVPMVARSLALGAPGLAVCAEARAPTSVSGLSTPAAMRCSTLRRPDRDTDGLLGSDRDERQKRALTIFQRPLSTFMRLGACVLHGGSFVGHSETVAYFALDKIREDLVDRFRRLDRRIPAIGAHRSRPAPE